MVDKIQTQSIDFLGDDLKKTVSKPTEAVMMDLNTQIAIGEMNKNYNKMVNNMLNTCANICLRNFANPKFTASEALCVENCQKKFYATYAIGESLIRFVMEEAKKTDLFSNKNEVDIVESARIRNSKVKL
jgi:hypothetical protein